MSEPAAANGMSTGYELIARYGDEAAWTNVVWTIIGILSALWFGSVSVHAVGNN